MVKHRFDPDTVAKLLAIKWWDWPEERIQAESDLIWSERVEEFVARYHSGGQTQALEEACRTTLENERQMPTVFSGDLTSGAKVCLGEIRESLHTNDRRQETLPRVLVLSPPEFYDPMNKSNPIHFLLSSLASRGWRCGLFVGTISNQSEETASPSKPTDQINGIAADGVDVVVESKMSEAGYVVALAGINATSKLSAKVVMEATLGTLGGIVQRFRPEVVLAGTDTPFNVEIASMVQAVGVRLVFLPQTPSDIDGGFIDKVEAMMMAPDREIGERQIANDIEPSA